MEVSDPQPVSLACVVPGRQGIGSKRIRPWQQERDSNKTPTIVTPDIRNDQFFTNLLDNVILPQMLMNETVEDMAKKMVMSVGGTEEKDVESPPSILFSTFTNTYGDMACLKLAEDAKMALAGCASSVLVWDWASRESHLEPYSFAEVLPSRSNAPSVSTVTHSSVSMDTATASEIPLELIGHSHRVCGVSLEEFSQEHRYVLSSSVDETVRLWDVSSRSCLARYTSISGVPWSVEFGPFGHHFVTGNQSGAAVLYSTDRAVPLRVFRGHTSDVSCSRFHPNAVYVATGSDDGYVRLWDIRDTVTGSVRVFKPPRRGAGGVTAVCWSPCGTLLGAGFEDGSAAIWEVSDGRSVFYLSDTSEPRAKRRNKSNPVHCMQFNHNSSAVITGGQDCAMKLWDFSAFQNDAKISNDTKLSGFRDSSSVFAGYLLSPHSSFHTKFSPIYAMSGFNSENGVVFAGGPSQLSFEA